MFGKLVDRKIKDMESVWGGRGGIAVYCLNFHDLAVEVWVEGAVLLALKVSCINFEGVCNGPWTTLFSGLGRPIDGLSREVIRVKNKGIGITVTMHRIPQFGQQRWNAAECETGLGKVF